MLKVKLNIKVTSCINDAISSGLAYDIMNIITLSDTFKMHAKLNTETPRTPHTHIHSNNGKLGTMCPLL